MKLKRAGDLLLHEVVRMLGGIVGLDRLKFAAQLASLPLSLAYITLLCSLSLQYHSQNINAVVHIDTCLLS